jgi:uncharacterized membrane protein
MNKMNAALKYRIWIALGIALICGTFIGLTYSYRSLFAGNWRLYPLIIWPSVLIGLLSGWKTIFNCLAMYFTTATLLFLRALIGREPDGDYITFIFKLTFGSVLDVVPISLFWAYIATLAAAAVIYIIRKKKTQQAGPGYPPQGVGSPDP